MKAYQIKIMMNGAKPPVWRRISIPAACTFAQLHESIQVLFGWMNYHLYEFQIPRYNVTIINTEYAKPDSFYRSTIHNAKAVTLKEYFIEGLRLTYTYDFGDDWRHSILVEKEIEQEKDYPILLKWKGDNFAEDAGNVHGYYEICKIANTSDHPECENMRQWLQIQHDDFYPDEVRMYLQNISINDTLPFISKLNSSELNTAIMVLKKAFIGKHFEDVVTIAIEKNRQHKMVAITEYDNTYSLQLYDNEKQYYHGVEFANPNSGFNIYANCVLLLMSDQPLPMGNGWCADDECCVIKTLKTGYLPLDIDNEDVPELVEYLYDIAAVCTKTKRLPNKQNSEYLYAIAKDQTWNLRIETISDELDCKAIHIIESQIKKWKQQAAYPYDVRIDLVAIPDNHDLNIFCVIEDEHQTSDLYIDMENINSFEALHIEVMHHICDFIEQHGIMKSIEVACQNMIIMLQAICKDLQIPLRYTDFITDYEQDVQNEVMDQNYQYLTMLQNLTEEEFNELIEQMDEQDLTTLEYFIKQFMDEEEQMPRFDA